MTSNIKIFVKNTGLQFSSSSEVLIIVAAAAHFKDILR